MTYTFDSQIATDVGLHAAIIYNYIVMTFRYAKATNQTATDSLSALCNLMPFISKDDIFNSIVELQKRDFIACDFKFSSNGDITVTFSDCKY